MPLKRYPLIVVFLLLLVLFKLWSNKRNGSSHDVAMNICSDGRGYYAWLPAVFIYHDLHFGFFETKELANPYTGGEKGGCLQNYLVPLSNGTQFNKYYPGPAVLQFPFFALAHLYVKYCTSYVADGYAPPYFYAVGLAGLFYYGMGLFFLLKIFRRFQISIKFQCLALVLFTFGTNLMYYTIDKPSYSHLYSFFLITLFLYLLFTITDDIELSINSAQNKIKEPSNAIVSSPNRSLPRLALLACLAFTSGLIAIVRPVNISIVLLLPFTLGPQLTKLWSLSSAKRTLLVKYLIPGSLPALFFPGLLLLVYKMVSGHFLLYSYVNESFDFLHPHFWQFLFHFDNGVFPYMPLLFFILLFSAYPLLFKNTNPELRRLTLALMLTLFVTFYIHSAWWCWNYGFAFGARTICDFLALFALLMVLTLKRSQSNYQKMIIACYSIAAIATLILYHQKNHGYLGLPVNDYWQALFFNLK